jgi:hypothetical protein
MARRAHATIPLPEPSPRNLQECVHELEALRDLVPGWNGYRAEPPGPLALTAARQALESLSILASLPERVIPSAEGGIALVFSTDPLYTALEIFNDGEILASFSDLAHRHEVWETGLDEAALRHTLERFGALLPDA